MDNEKIIESENSISDIIIYLERAQSLLRYLLSDGAMSRYSDFYKAENWMSLEFGEWDQTVTFTEIIDDYVEKTVDEARKLEDILFKIGKLTKNM